MTSWEHKRSKDKRVEGSSSFVENVGEKVLGKYLFTSFVVTISIGRDDRLWVLPNKKQS